MGARMPFRELAGALVVDPLGGATEADRIFVITEWNSFTANQLHEVMTADEPGARFLALQPAFTFVINGLSWPATERLTYRRGEVVHWRVINLSSQSHPMHLHGFYFRVKRAGDGLHDDPVDDGRGRSVVTHLLPAGGTLSLEWTPEREGNWLFHCHVMAHVSLARRLDAGTHAAEADATHRDSHHTSSDRSLGMAGMVMGITVLPSAAVGLPASMPSLPTRHVTMAIRRADDALSGGIATGMALNDGPTADPDAPVVSPGPPLVLTRGEPTEITVINRLEEPTSIHWHGLEIDSYYDGVHGWSGTPTRTAPIIEPGGRFAARLTPPRAGTFIYHTHLHDYRQLSSGLYGALIVTEPGHAFDPNVDHVVVLGRRQASVASSVLADADSLVVNGERMPRWMWRSGRRHRLRLVNITPDDILAVSLRNGDAPVLWRPLLKDGAPTSAELNQDTAATVTIAVGETYDFEVNVPPGRGTLWLDVRSTNGKWQAQGQVIVK
jgi:FtsP/CotA-like multicopper oxidase with cupredoxin domain